jgi:hypothetical protein
VLLKLEEGMISNLLVMRRPVEIDEERERERLRKLGDFLGVDLLEFKELSRDYIAESEKDLWMTDLDIDFLDQDFLVDVLDQTNAALARQMKDQLDSTQTKTTLGKDPETGIELYDQQPQWLFRRQDSSNTVQLRLNKGYGYNINIQQDDFEFKDYKLGDGKNDITIKQVQ